MIEDWIDRLCDVWAISDGKNGTVKSYHYYDRAEFPSAITVFPCAITIPQMVRPEYSAGGPLKDHWRGFTEFHLVPSLDRQHIPYCVLFVARIRNAAASNANLGGLVDHFYLRQDLTDTIRGPVKLQWNENDTPHLGIVVQWEVKDGEEGKYTFGGG